MGEQRLVVVTGGSRGIGRSVVRRFAARGHRVLALGRDEAGLKETVEPLGEAAGLVVCDVTDPEAVEASLGSRPVDILVNNAGVASSAPLERTTLEDWERALAVNATGAFLCTRAVVGGMRERGFGRILFVASVSAHVGIRYTSAYTAAKHAMVGLMRAVAAEVGGSPITANAVCPSYVATEMTERAVAGIVTATGRSEAQAQQALISQTPLGRLLEPEEVAAALEFLASDEAGAINGQTIVLDGGALQR